MDTPESDSLLILGTGALANLFAARLAQGGVQVTMLGTWPAGLAALQEHGVRLVDADGEHHYPVRASSSAHDCAPTSQALVLVKAWQTARAAQHLKACLAPDGLALSLQNGLGNRETLAEVLGAKRVALGTTTTGATLLGPGRVRPGGEGVISLEDHPALGPLRNLLTRAGFQLKTAPDVDSLMWGKLVINAAINPLTALLGIPNGALLTSPSARKLMAAAAQEVAAVAGAYEVPLPFQNPAGEAETVARRTAANRSSMLQDVQRGAPTEIDAICGAVVRFGQEVGQPTPVNHALWRLVRALVESQAQGNAAPTAEIRPSTQTLAASTPGERRA